MSKPLWESVDRFLIEALSPEAENLNWILEANRAAELPEIDVTPLEAKLLCQLLELSSAKTVLELGTLGGYSTIWMAMALPDGGKITTLELELNHVRVARANFEKAKVDDKIHLVPGLALESLEKLVDDDSPLFDFVFVDADKPNSANYFEWVLKLTHPGSVIVFDNVVRDGEVANPESKSPEVIGIQKLIRAVQESDQVSATAIQTVSSKGYDGFLLAIRK